MIHRQERASPVDCESELTALMEFTKPKVVANTLYISHVYVANKLSSIRMKLYLFNSLDGFKATMPCTLLWNIYP